MWTIQEMSGVSWGWNIYSAEAGQHGVSGGQ